MRPGRADRSYALGSGGPTRAHLATGGNGVGGGSSGGGTGFYTATVAGGSATGSLAHQQDRLLQAITGATIGLHPGAERTGAGRPHSALATSGLGKQRLGATTAFLPQSAATTGAASGGRFHQAGLGLGLGGLGLYATQREAAAAANGVAGLGLAGSVMGLSHGTAHAATARSRAPLNSHGGHHQQRTFGSEELEDYFNSTATAASTSASGGFVATPSLYTTREQAATRRAQQSLAEPKTQQNVVQGQQHQIVSAIREQLHSLAASASASASASVSASASAAPSASASVNPSTAHSLAPSPSPSDLGSDDDIADVGSSQPSHARPTSAVSAHLGERLRSTWMLDPNPTAQLTQAPPTAAPPLSPVPLGGRGRAAANTNAAQAQAQTSAQGRTSSKPTTPSTLHPHEITIHVHDENRGVSQDFRCDRHLLIAGMQYFRAYLAPAPPSSTAAPPADVDISVHCDVLIFQWLLSYIAWEQASGLLEIESKRARRDSATASAAAKPVLDLSNVVSILISSDFLQMSRLVNECLRFVRRDLAAIVKSPLDLACLSDTLVERLAALYEDQEDRFDAATPEHDDTTSSPGTGSRDLSHVSEKDRRDKIVGRLWRAKLERMLTARMEAAGRQYTLQQCMNCSQKFWQDLNEATEEKTNFGARSFCPSPSARRRVDFHGSLSAAHVACARWSVKKWLLSLRVAGTSWEACWWLCYGLCHSSPPDCPCNHCGAERVAYAHMRACRFHEQDAQWIRRFGVAPSLVHPCCGQPAQPFGSGGGCKVREHAFADSRARGDKSVLATVREHLDQITWQEEELGATAVAAAANASVVFVEDAPRKKMNITFAKEHMASSSSSGATVNAKLAPSILGPAMATTLASYSSAPPATTANNRRASSSAVSKRAPRTSDDESEYERGASSYEGTSCSSGTDASDWTSDDEGFEDDEDEDDGPPTAAQKQAAQAERLKFRRGYEGANPHGHTQRARPRPAADKNSASPTRARPGPRSYSFAPSIGALDPLAEKALAQLRDVLPPDEFVALAQSVAANSNSNGVSVPVAERSSLIFSATAAKRAQSANAVRVVGGPARNNRAAVSTVATTKKPKGILKPSVVIPSAQASGSGPSSAAAAAALSELSSVWGASSAPTAARSTRSGDVSPPRSNGGGGSAFNAYATSEALASRKAASSKAAYALDYLLEDDRQRMTNLISSLTQNRGAPNQAAPATTPALPPPQAHGRSSSNGGQVPLRAVLDRVQSAHARRPSGVYK